MRKVYLEPELELINLISDDFLAASFDDFQDDFKDNVDGSIGDSEDIGGIF